MEVRNLVTFLKVTELKSFSRAAEALDYSQSAVTVQIQQLERELGVQLFDRIGKTVSITQYGKNFFHKDTPELMAATHIPYVATVAESNPTDFIRKAAKAASRFWYSATPSAKYLAFSLPTQIRSIFCMTASSFQDKRFRIVSASL